MNKKELRGYDLVITFIESTQESSSTNMEEYLCKDEVKQREKDSDDLEASRDFITKSLLSKGNLIKELTTLKSREQRIVEVVKKLLKTRTCTSHKIGECPSEKESLYKLASEVLSELGVEL